MQEEKSQRTIRLTIAFDGTEFFGWQVQPNAPTIQGEIERNLGTIHRRPVTVHGAGRTDTGVHARAMVAHFHTDKTLTAEAFVKALNSMLPEAIRILEAVEVEPDFHARFSAKGKTYAYSLFNGAILPPHRRLYTVQVRKPLNFTAVGECLDIIRGTHDFASFETAGSRDPSTTGGRGSVRTISDVQLISEGNGFYLLIFTGDGFLRHMVRNIVGTLLEVALGRYSVEDFKAILLALDRSSAGPAAPARGLSLLKVHY